MTEAIVLHPQVRVWLGQSALAPFVSSYINYLRSQRYAERTHRGYTYGVAHFAHRLSAQPIGLSGVDEEAARAFLEDHLPGYDCPHPARRSAHENRTALRHLLSVLRANGAIGERPTSPDPTASELALFDRYMDHVCGLAANTRRQRICMLRRLFSTHGGLTPGGGSPGASSMRSFFLNRRNSWSAGTVQVMSGALRCYLRFRALAGDDVRGLQDRSRSCASRYQGCRARDAVGLILACIFFGTASLPNLLRHRSPLKEIADLLRHRSLDTSMIYTKVDLRRLTAVAMSWPGRQL
jgi:hypothetical protein